MLANWCRGRGQQGDSDLGLILLPPRRVVDSPNSRAPQRSPTSWTAPCLACMVQKIDDLAMPYIMHDERGEGHIGLSHAAHVLLFHRASRAAGAV